MGSSKYINMATKVTEASVKALAQGVVESEECVNNVVDLLEHLQVSNIGHLYFNNLSTFLACSRIECPS